jgi:hypothetical protein
MGFIRFLPIRYLPNRNLPSVACRPLVSPDGDPNCQAHIFGLIDGEEISESFIGSMSAHSFFVILID